MTTKELQRQIEALGRPRIDLRMFNGQRATLTYQNGTETKVTPDDECFQHVVNLVRYWR
jgi:hypothetical protein